MTNHEQDKGQSLATPENIGTLEQYIEKHAKFEEGRFVYVDIPLNMIERPDIPVDQEHVEELAEQMQEFRKEHDIEGGNGQQEDVMLAQIDGDDMAHIIEGLHRVPAIEINGNLYARSKILMHSSKEEVVKMRMSGVKEHRRIRAARSVNLINDLWQFTEWQDKYPELTSKQVFSLTNDGRSGKELGIANEDLELIKQWATDRAEECDLTVATIDKHIRLLGSVDSEIIANSREMHGKKDSPYFASANLKWLAKHLRGEFDKQKLVVELAIAKNLNSAQVEKIAVSVAGFNDLAEAHKHIMNEDFIVQIQKPQSEQKHPVAIAKPTQAPTPKTTPTPTKVSPTAKPSVAQEAVATTETEVAPIKIIPPKSVKEKRALVLAKEIIVKEVINGSYQDMVAFVKSGRYVCLPNEALEQPYFITDRTKEDDDNSKNSSDIKIWRQITEEFKIWTPEERVELKNRLAERRTLIDRLTEKRIDGIKPGRGEAKKAFELAIDRVVRDTRIGALQHIKDLDGVIDKSIFINCLLDQLHSQMDPRRSATTQSARVHPKYLKFNDFATLLSEERNMKRRRAITYGAVFKLTSTTIAQLIGDSKQFVDDTLRQSSRKLK